MQVNLGASGEVRGLELEDTVAIYDTLDGQTKIKPSNRVCLYSPRFAAVRHVASVIENLLTTYTIMQSSIVKTKLNFAPPDIYIKPALTNIRATEFHRYDEIMEGVRDDVAVLKDELERSLKKRRWFF